MGCDIHLIVQVSKKVNDDNWYTWEWVPEKPKSLCANNYPTFAFLARGVRDYFMSEKSGGFEIRGLPPCIGTGKFGWKSYSESAKKRYEEATEKKVWINNTYKNINDPMFTVVVGTEEEAKKHDYYSCSYGRHQEFSYQDPTLYGGQLMEVHIKDLMSFDDFMKCYYEDEWDEDQKDYGTYDVDFTCEDYHSASWCTLQELIDADKSDYYKTKVKVHSAFWNKFKELNGVLPEGMEVIEERIPSGIIEAIRMEYHPDVMICWNCSEEEKQNSMLYKGIEELKEIAKKHNITDFNDIRIVYAFDN